MEEVNGLEDLIQLDSYPVQTTLRLLFLYKLCINKSLWNLGHFGVNKYVEISGVGKDITGGRLRNGETVYNEFNNRKS